MPLYTKAGKLVIGNNQLATSNECCCCCGLSVCNCTSCTHPSAVVVDLTAVTFTWCNVTKIACCFPEANDVQSVSLPVVTLSYCPGLCGGHAYRALVSLGATIQTYEGKCQYFGPGECSPITTSCCNCIDYPVDTDNSCLEAISLNTYLLVTLFYFGPTTNQTCTRTCSEGVGKWRLDFGVLTQGKQCCDCENRDSQNPMLACTPTSASDYDQLNDFGIRSYEFCSGQSVLVSGTQPWMSSGNSCAAGGLSAVGGDMEKVNSVKGVPCQDKMDRTNPCNPTGTYHGYTTTSPGTSIYFTVA